MYIEIGENLFVYTKLCGIQQPEIYGTVGSDIPKKCSHFYYRNGKNSKR